jgi:hypothetical protein
MKLVELYFCDVYKPAGQRFLGAVLMKANRSSGSNEAFIKRAWRLGLNPGGSVGLFDIDSSTLAGFTYGHLDRLLTEEECLALNLFERRQEAGE